MNIEQARTNMLKQQFRTAGVVDEKLLTLLEKTPRELFVPLAYQAQAFAEMNIPMDEYHSMPTPQFEAQMIQALQVQPYDKVLEIGTGTGYVTAILSQLAQHVYSVDLNAAFTQQANQHLASLKLNNVTFATGDAAAGWPEQALYDVIVIHGSLPTLTDNLRSQLQIAGRLFAVLGNAPLMQATLIERKSEETWSRQVLFETSRPPLHTLSSQDTFFF